MVYGMLWDMAPWSRSRTQAEATRNERHRKTTNSNSEEAEILKKTKLETAVAGNAIAQGNGDWQRQWRICLV
jgi:hypothetical protein